MGQEPGSDPGQEPTKTEPGQEPAPKTEPKTFDEAYVTKLRQEAAEARRASKDFEAKVQQFEERDKSEADKAADRAKQLEDKATKAESEVLRLRVALSKKVPAELIDRLRGDTQEALEADADELLKLVTPDATGFDGGARTPAPAGDMDSVIRQRAGRA